MHRTEGANNDGNLFKDGPPGTTVGAAILNAIQEEICNVIEKAGIAVKTQSTETRDQLAKAISDFVDKTKYGIDNEATDAYVITRSPAPSVLYDGMMVAFKANTANTGAATLNDTGLGAKDIRKDYDQVLITGDIKAGQITTVRYDITNGWYQIQVGPISISDTVYGAGWNGITTIAPSKNAVYDEMEKKADAGDSIVKAWVRFDGTKAVGLIDDSFNVTTVVDNAAGDYTINWTTNFANADYSVVVSCGTNTEGETAHIQSIAVGNVLIHTDDVTWTPIDSSIVCVIAIGDQ